MAWHGMAWPPYLPPATASALQGNLTEAIDNYHIALGSRPEDTFTAEMLTVALHEECAQYSHELAAAG